MIWLYIIYYIIYLLIFIPMGKYFYNFIKKITKVFKYNIEKTKVKYFVIILISSIIIVCSNPKNIGIMILIHLFLYCIIVDGSMLIVKKSKLSKNSKLDLIYNLGIIPIALTVITFIYGYWNINNIIETKYKIYTEKELSQNYNIILISDLHFGLNMNISKLEKYAKEIAKQDPDFIILGGDIVDENTKKEDITQVFEILGNIKNKHGIFFIFGNHDKSLNKILNSSYTEEELKKAISDANIEILEDEIFTINNEITLIGRTDASFSKNIPRLSSEDFMKNLNKDNFLMILDHQPIDIMKNATLGYDLQLSGHTHGGQIFPIGIIDQLLKINEMNYGHKKIKDYQIIVSSGIAGWGYPFRTENKSEYVNITIENK